VENRILGIEDKIDTKEKDRILRKKSQELQMEYARTLRFHQKTKPTNHGH
jgi:hypothetical protein